MILTVFLPLAGLFAFLGSILAFLITLLFFCALSLIAGIAREERKAQSPHRVSCATSKILSYRSLLKLVDKGSPSVSLKVRVPSLCLSARRKIAREACATAARHRGGKRPRGLGLSYVERHNDVAENAHRTRWVRRLWLRPRAVRGVIAWVA